MKELILQVRNSDDLSFLSSFGEVLFSDDIVDIVVIECEEDKIEKLKDHPMVLSMSESRKDGMLLNILN